MVIWFRTGLPGNAFVWYSRHSPVLEQRWEIYQTAPIICSWTSLRPETKQYCLQIFYQISTLLYRHNISYIIAFWLPEEKFNENDFRERLRESAIATVWSHVYRSMDRNVTNEESKIIQDQTAEIINELGVELQYI